MARCYYVGSFAFNPSIEAKIIWVVLEAKMIGASIWVLVLAAVTQDGRALDGASADLKNDEDVMLAAVTQNRSAS